MYMAPELFVFGPNNEYGNHGAKSHRHGRQNDDDGEHGKRIEIAVVRDRSGYRLHYSYDRLGYPNTLGGVI